MSKRILLANSSILLFTKFKQILAYYLVNGVGVKIPLWSPFAKVGRGSLYPSLTKRGWGKSVLVVINLHVIWYRL